MLAADTGSTADDFEACGTGPALTYHYTSVNDRVAKIGLTFSRGPVVFVLASLLATATSSQVLNLLNICRLVNNRS